MPNNTALAHVVIALLTFVSVSIIWNFAGEQLQAQQQAHLWNMTTFAYIGAVALCACIMVYYGSKRCKGLGTGPERGDD